MVAVEVVEMMTTTVPFDSSLGWAALERIYDHLHQDLLAIGVK